VGIYLVDVFDNVTRVAELEGAALFEPVPLAPRPRPPAISDRIRRAIRRPACTSPIFTLGLDFAACRAAAVKRLRVFAYHFNYERTGGPESVGLGRVEAGWDIRRLLGTVAVEADGSACFEIPANTPVSLQPLDADGAARSSCAPGWSACPASGCRAWAATRTTGRQCLWDARWQTRSLSRKSGRSKGRRGRTASRARCGRSRRSIAWAATAIRTKPRCGRATRAASQASLGAC
jgi:hypothetical protein